MNLKIVNKDFVLKSKQVAYDDIYNQEFYTQIHDINDSFISDIDEVNEIYINRVLPVYAIKFFIESNKVTTISQSKTNREIKRHVKDAINLTHLFQKLHHKKSLLPIYIIISSIIVTFSLIYLLFLNIFIIKKRFYKTSTENLVVVRTPAAYSKIKRVIDDKIIYEAINNSDFYGNVNLFLRLRFCFESFGHSVKDLKSIYKYINKNIGINNALDSIIYYSKRIIHKNLYKKTLDYILLTNNTKIMYTGNNLDRFANVETIICKKNNVKLICVPHGIEYGFLLPREFSGDIFYTSSNYSSLFLNNLYSSHKYQYDEKIAKKMFTIDNPPLSSEIKSRKIVYFTEPRDISINIEIITNLINYLKQCNIILHLKLHPKDSILNYSSVEKDIVIIENFSEAIYYNICISRKSTILIEALYNQSLPAAIITNHKDKSMYNLFPALNDDRIKKFTSIETLCGWIKIMTENERIYK